MLLYGVIGLESSKVGRSIVDVLYFVYNWEVGNNMNIKLRNSVLVFKKILYISLVF